MSVSEICVLRQDMLGHSALHHSKRGVRVSGLAFAVVILRACAWQVWAAAWLEKVDEAATGLLLWQEVALYWSRPTSFPPSVPTTSTSTSAHNLTLPRACSWARKTACACYCWHCDSIIHLPSFLPILPSAPPFLPSPPLLFIHAAHISPAGSLHMFCS